MKVVICDNKSSYDYDFLNAPLYKGVKECIKVINDFEKEIDSRQKENKRHKRILIRACDEDYQTPQYNSIIDERAREKFHDENASQGYHSELPRQSERYHKSQYRQGLNCECKRTVQHSSSHSNGE